MMLTFGIDAKNPARTFVSNLSKLVAVRQLPSEKVSVSVNIEHAKVTGNENGDHFEKNTTFILHLFVVEGVYYFRSGEHWLSLLFSFRLFL